MATAPTLQRPKSTLREYRGLYNLRTGKEITSLHIAERAGVQLADEWTVEIGGLVTLGLASKVLDAYKDITGEQLKLDDIALQIKSFKPNIAYLCNTRGITALDLAQAANRPVLDVWDMVGGSVRRDTASAILASFNALAKTSYSLNDVRVSLID